MTERRKYVVWLMDNRRYDIRAGFRLGFDKVAAKNKTIAGIENRNFQKCQII